MKRSFFGWLGLATLLMGGCHSPATPDPAPAAPASPPAAKVVVISIDGLRPDAVRQPDTPNILALIQRGASTRQAQTILPSVTLASHASMLSGYNPVTHGITWDDYQPQRGTIAVPTVFTYAHAAGLRTVMVVGKNKLAHLDAPGTVDAYVCAEGGDADVANQALAVARGGFHLMFVHLPDVDLTGHAKGWMSPAYAAQVAATDQILGRILGALPAQTTVVLTADHGGHANTHGFNVPEDMTILWTIAGPTVTKGLSLSTAVKTTDTAATAAYVLGFKLAADVVGRPVLEAFQAGTRSTASNHLLVRPEAGVRDAPLGRAPSLPVVPREARRALEIEH
jgi:predicted AlkP superfamily pyrophosphatase or phosphodiesterase